MCGAEREGGKGGGEEPRPTKKGEGDELALPDIRHGRGGRRERVSEGREACGGRGPRTEGGGRPWFGLTPGTSTATTFPALISLATAARGMKAAPAPRTTMSLRASMLLTYERTRRREVWTPAALSTLP